MAAVPVVWTLTRPLAADVRERLALSVLIGGSGAAMLFFGYVETYAPAFVMLLAFIAAAQRVREGHGSLLTLSVLFVVLVFLHVGMALFAPVLLLLLGGAARGKRWKDLAVAVLGSAVAAALILVLLSYSPARLLATFLRDGGSFLPLRGTDGWNESYTLFSLWHWIDLLNLSLIHI